MSESNGDRRASDNAAGGGSSEDRRSHVEGRQGQSDGRQSKPASDPVADLQRWLMRAGARSMANQVADNVRRTLGQQQKRDSGDVWDTATTEPPQDEPPECQWCPVCQAARRLRESGPGGLGAKLADVGGVLGSVVQDAFSAVDQMMKTQNTSSERTVATPPATAPPNGADDGNAGPANHDSSAAHEHTASPDSTTGPESSASPETGP